MEDARAPSSLHSNFFSSLKQVEKRMKLEHPSQKFTSPSLEGTKLSTEESLSSPIYLHSDQPSNNTNNNNDQSSNTLEDCSEAPEAFISCSPIFPQTQENPPQSNALYHSETINETDTDAIDDIQVLLQLLGLSHCQEEGEEERAGLELEGNDGNSCHCEGGFYEKIVGVKGPKCGKEVERLEGWINYFLDGDGRGGLSISGWPICFWVKLLLNLKVLILVLEAWSFLQLLGIFCSMVLPEQIDTAPN